MKTYSTLILIVFFFSLNLLSQDVRLCVQTGHSATINALEYSPDATLIASASADNNVAIWHIESGKQYANLSGHTGSVTAIAFHPLESIIYSAGMDSTLIVWDLGKARIEETIKFDFPLSALDLDEQNNRLLIAGEGLELMDLSSKDRTKFKLRSKALFTAASFSESGKWLAVGGKNDRFTYVVDPTNKEIVGQVFGAVNDLVFDEEEKAIYCAAENGGIIYFDFYQNRVEGVTNKSEWNSFNGVRITNRYLIGTTDKAEVVVFNRQNYKKINVLKSHLKGVKCLDIDPGGQYMVTAGEGKRIILWDLDELEMIRTFQSSIYRISQINFSEDGDEITIGFSNGAVRRSNLLTNDAISNRARLGLNQTQNGWQFLLTGIEKNEANSATFNMYLFRNSVLIEGAYDYLSNVRLFWDTYLNEVVVDEVDKGGRKISEYEKALRRGKVLPQSYFIDESFTQTQDKKYSAQIKGNFLQVKDQETGMEVFFIETGHTDRITSVAINSKYNFVATSGWDGMIKFWDLADGKLLTTYGAFGGTDFVYISPDNYYYASKGALDNVGFVFENQMFAFDQFDLLYNRPDLVFEYLPYISDEIVGHYNRAYKKRLDKLNLNESDLGISLDIPQLELINKTGVNTLDGVLRMQIKATDYTEELKACHIVVNGVPVYGRNGKPIDTDSISFNETVRMNPGKNFVQVYATNKKGVSSFKKGFQVTSKQEVESNLYVMAIGCSKYEQREYNLNFAEKDASDIVKFFEKSEGFNQVFTKKLVNQDVVRQSSKSMFDFFKPAKENDVVLLFVAGHGVLDADLDYYIASHDIDFQHPNVRGIPIQFFENLMDGVKSRKKLMFIDACHSGEIDKSEVVIDTTSTSEQDADLVFRAVGNKVKNIDDVNSFELSKMAFADMRESNGSTVISSAGGGEFAMEGKKWSNGVFTYCLLKGLETGEADLNQDKAVLISELHTYLIRNVNQITGGKQTPTSRVENLNNDFRIQ